MKLWLLLVLLWFAGLNAQAADSDSTKLFTEYTAESFRQYGPAGEQIDFEKVNFDLLSAAVFHETNRCRSDEKLSPLRPNAKLRAVAGMQATIMAKRGSISHVNPKLPEKKTPEDRFRLAGLQPAFAAENVATAFGLVYRDGEQVYVREKDGRKVFSRQPDGPPIEMHTYLSFAEALLESWMNSPPHRKNIIATEPEYLGTSCEPKVSAIGMPVFYCAQEFYTPLPPPFQSTPNATHGASPRK